MRGHTHRLPPLRLLIVEDETLISLLIETVVRELGHDPVAAASNIPAALQAVTECDIDAAVLDVNLGGMLVFPVAEALEARDIPFAFLTGYGAHGIPSRFSYASVTQKPFTEGDLAETMAHLQQACLSQDFRATG